MLKKIQNLIYRLCLIDCVGCGSFVVHSCGLCLKCEKYIFNEFRSTKRESSLLPKSGIPFRFIFHWVPGQSDVLSRYVHLLKSPLAKPIWFDLSKNFKTQNNLISDIIYVPIPSRKRRRHSEFFAEALAATYGGRVLLALEVSSTDIKEQKRKSREERLKIRFELIEEFTELLRMASTVILVDDVITTGASYQSAYNVLKNHGVWPENIELWAAFYRERMKVDF